MKGCWIVVLGTMAACAVGCDDTSDGTGGSGTTSSSSTKSSSGTMTTTGTGSSSSGDPQALACGSAAAAQGMAAADLMCDANTQASVLAACNKDFMDFPNCSMELLALYDCIGTDTPSASCSCDPADNGLVCMGLCGAELTAATMCATP